MVSNQAEFFEARLIEVIKRTSDVFSFRFLPQKKIDFLPGQFLRVIFNLENLEDRTLNKYLSFSNSPFTDYIEITKRISKSDFSKSLISLKKLELVNFYGPLGNCVYKDNYKKIIFLIGGIGITPVISMLSYIYEKNLSCEIVIFYANRNEEIPFKKWLDELSKKLGLKIFYLVSEIKENKDDLIKGILNKEIIFKINHWEESIVFIFGPPKMVEETKKLVNLTSVKTDNIKTESFLGY